MATPVSTSADSLDLLQPEVLAGLSNLDLIARSAVEGVMMGLHRSPRFGFSQEFAEYRSYAEGDDPRFIDWNVYARTDRTMVKRFLGETNSHLMLLLDASASMGFGKPPVTKLRYAQIIAASLAYLATRQHDAVGCLVFDEQVREFRPPSSRTGQLRSVVHAIDAAVARIGTRFDSPFEQIRARNLRRGIVAVISDFYCDADELINSVQPLAWRGQDIILIQVLADEELEPAFANNVLLEDVETGAAIEVAPEFLRESYPARLNAHIDRIHRAAAGIGADHLQLATSDRLDLVLRNYLLFRERRQ